MTNYRRFELDQYLSQTPFIVGYALASTAITTGYNPVVETDFVFLAVVAGATVMSWQRLAGAISVIDNTIPSRGGPDVPAARAYASLVWETHNNAGAGSSLLMYGGSVNALPLSLPLGTVTVNTTLRTAPESFSVPGAVRRVALPLTLPPGTVTVNTTLRTAPGTENDSGVLAGLWQFSLTLTRWTRLDAAFPAPTAGDRGQPRLTPAAESGIPHPGGRVFHAMNIAANGDVYLYGGRGHAVGAYVRPIVQPALLLSELPAPAPFTLPLKGRFSTTVNENDAVSLHAFLYTKAEMEAAGLPADVPLSSLDVMVKLSTDSVFAETGVWDSTSRFRVRSLLTSTSLTDFTDTTASFLDTYESSLLAQPVVSIDPTAWAPGTFMAINSPYMKDSFPDSATVTQALSSSNYIILIFAVEYKLSGTGNTSQLARFGLETTDTIFERALSLLKNAGSATGLATRNYVRSTMRPVLLFRSPLPAHPLTQPPVSLSP